MSTPYSRVYWSVMDDDKFDGIREDVRLFGSWALLLVVADMAYPAPAFIPPTVPRKCVALLVAAGLIEELAGHRFRVHGLAKEREQRSDSARNAAALRWQSKGNAKPMLDETEHRRDETSIAGAREGLADIVAESRRRPPPDAAHAAWEEATGRTVLGSGQFALDLLNDMVARHGVATVSLAIRKARASFEHIPATQPLAVAVRNLLDPLPNAKDTKAAEATERESTRSRRAVEATILHAHDTGFHVEPDPRCPKCKASS